MGLTARFWGVRGSIPSPGPTTVRYGGNTPCLELRTSTGRLVVLDGGTGLRPLGNALMTELEEGRGWEGDLFVTHTHWDHIQGLPFFAPLYREGTLRVWGPCVHEGELERVVREQMRPAVFPIGVDRLTAHIEINRVDERFEHSDGFELTAIACRHPGGALGYRVRDPAGGGSVVYVSDNELGLGADRESPSE